MCDKTKIMRLKKMLIKMKILLGMKLSHILDALKFEDIFGMPHVGSKLKDSQNRTTFFTELLRRPT